VTILGFNCPSQRYVCDDGLIVEDHIEEGAVDVYTAIVLNEAKLAEPIQKETDARARGADDFGQRFLTDLRNDGLRFSFFAEVGQ
jgi:hypothetical protein